jgi:preprotein translocase subunit SecE
MFTGLAQLVEHWSPKPGVGSSSLSTRANNKNMTGIITYFKESFEELKNNVTPPTFSEGLVSMIVVAIFSIIFSLIIWGIDSVFGKVMEYYFNFIG